MNNADNHLENGFASDHVLAVIDIPGSKSLTHRALLLAALSEGESRIVRPLMCEDTSLTLAALKKLGAGIEADGEDLVVRGTAGRLAGGGGEIDLGNSGTSMRLLTSTAALSPGPWTLTGTKRMRERPIAALLEALNALGGRAASLSQGGCPPVKIEGGGLKGGRARISAKKSSQYLSSLLLAGPYAESDVLIEVVDEVASWPYVQLTLDMMAAFGVEVERKGRNWFRVPAGQRYHGREIHIEGDCSSAAYFWAGAAVTGRMVVTRHIRPFSRQPDFAFVDLLSAMGCEVTLGQDWVGVQGAPLHGIDVDMNAMPDQVPTLAVCAALAQGETVIRNVGHLRYKESDRLGDLAGELTRLGIQAKVEEDGLRVLGGGLGAGQVNPHADHRLAMSFAVAQLVKPEIEILDPDCVGKSFPEFWALFGKLKNGRA